MALMVGGQLWDKARRGGGDSVSGARTLSAIALVGIVASSLWAARYYHLLSEPAQRAIAGAPAGIYLAMSIAGGAIELVAWAALFVRREFSRGWLAAAATGLVVNFIGTAVMNETIRLVTLDASIGLPTLYARHAASWKVAGLPVFLVFFAVNVALMALCVNRVRRRAGNQAG
jgi:hypothetical protein